VIAEGTADELKGKVGGEVLEVVVGNGDINRVAGILSGLGRGEPIRSPDGTRLTLTAAGGGVALVAEAARALDLDGVDIRDLGLRRPTLDDVFLTLTGRAAEDAARNAETSGDGGRPSRRRRARSAA
jgi:ABC-2 type transport system ATP-binding protein